MCCNSKTPTPAPPKPTPAKLPVKPCPCPVNPTVTIRAVIRGNPYVPRSASVAGGMPNSVPPSKTYEVEVTVSPSLECCPGQYLDLAIVDSTADNGTATISPARITKTTTATVTGGSQTKPGHAGLLKIQAKAEDGTIKFLSAGFSVCAHPINYGDSFAQDVNGGAVGVKVADSWDSDSGTLTDLNETEVSEVVAEAHSDSPPWDPAGSGTGNNSGYLPGDKLTVDSHTWGRPPAGPAGTKEFTQLSIFKCRRCGATDKVQPNSGMRIIHEVYLVGTQWKHRTRKIGEDVTIGAYSTKAGSANVTSYDHDLP